MDHRKAIEGVIAWTLTLVFVFTAIITALSLLGLVKFQDETQQERLFWLLIVELVVVCIGYFRGFLTYRSLSKVTPQQNPEIDSAPKGNQVAQPISRAKKGEKQLPQQIGPVPKSTSPLVQMTVESILKDIASRPPFQRAEAEAHYIGTRICLKGVLSMLLRKNDRDVTLCICPKDSHFPTIWVYTRVSEYPELKVIKEGDPIMVDGRISAFQHGDVVVTDVKLSGTS